MSPILLIEHDVAIGRLFETALREAGYTVSLAHNAAEGYKVLHRHAVALVITDLNMPGGMGPAIVSVVRRQFPKTKLLASPGKPVNSTRCRRRPCSTAWRSYAIRSASTTYWTRSHEC